MKANKKLCPHCGRELYEVMVRSMARRDPGMPIVGAAGRFPQVPEKTQTVAVTKQWLQKLDEDYCMLGEFAAWVCGVSINELNRFHIEEFMRDVIENAQRVPKPSNS